MESKTPARFIAPMAYRVTLSNLWSGECSKDEASGDNLKSHYAETQLDFPITHWPSILEARAASFDWEQFPTLCNSCGAQAPGYSSIEESKVFIGLLYPTESQYPEPGDLYFWPHHKTRCPAGWTNCDGNHLIAVLPNGAEWDIDGRDPICNLNGESTHRCWHRNGITPNISIDKNGAATCGSGGGSITLNNWSGYLRNGQFLKA